MKAEQVCQKPSPNPLGLKAERVQEALAAIGETHGRLKAERVQELLEAGWSLTQGGQVIRRLREFPEARVASAYSGYVSELASALRLPVHVQLSGKQLAVVLRVFSRRDPRLVDGLIAFAGGLG